MFLSSLKKRAKFFASLFILSTVLISFSSWKNPIKNKTRETKVFVSQFENVLGTSFEMKVKAVSNKQAANAEKIALNEIARLSSILSGYDKNSEFSKWMKTYNVAVKCSDELIEVLSLFDYWKQKTNGALNPAFEVLGKVWKDAAATQQLPSNTIINSALNIAAQQHWLINTENKTITHLTNAPLLLNTFVKSYIINKATQKVLNETGAESVVMNIGGDILAKGNNDEQVTITNPQSNAINDDALDFVKIKDKFIATSGNYRRGYLINNKWYSHIIDPRTGTPADNILSATVIASNATDAGALATSFNILTVDESIALAKQFPDVAYLIITKDGKKIQSNNWASFQTKKESTPAENITVLKNDTWDSKYELVVNLELAQIEGPYRRPFVAIWVVDKDKNPLRTLTVWYNKPRWLHDLRAWYSANYSKFNPEAGTISSVSSATRPAGKYAIKWDGKDDKGELVKTGNYTINIEVAREHGSYQLITQEVKINNKTLKIDIAGNPEVAGASIEVKKHANE